MAFFDKSYSDMGVDALTLEARDSQSPLRTLSQSGPDTSLSPEPLFL